MKRIPFCLIVLFLLGFGPLQSYAQEQLLVLWSGTPLGDASLLQQEEWDGKREVTNVLRPDLKVFLPANPSGSVPAIIVCPGGGYSKLCIEKEGYKVARWLASQGVAAFVLKYRLNRDEALEDAQQALNLLREESGRLGIDANKIGIMGFSAGAHLACNLAVNHDSSGPDFWAGVYGVYGGIFKNGRNPAGGQQVSPAFLVHAGDDSKVPVKESLDAYLLLRKMEVPAEMHIYEHGNHGFALERNRGEAINSTVDDWSLRLLEWLRLRKIL